MLQAFTNGAYPNRIQLTLGSYIGPFVQNGPLGAFNPIRDLSIWVDGSLQTIQSWSFDTTNNRYLMYLNQAVNAQGFVQVVHHVPNPPFADMLPTELLGFALVAGYIPGGDTYVPAMSLTAVPAIVQLGTASVFLLWLTTGVAQVKIEFLFGSPPFITGFLGANGIYVLPLTGVPIGVYTLIMTGYDSLGNPVLVGSPPAPLTATATLTITNIGYLVQDDGVSRFLLDDPPGYILLDT